MQKTVKNIENVVISVQKLTQMPSTIVENVRQINLFLQNKPNFPHFSPENEDFAKKQTQFKPKQTQSKPILGQYQGWQTQFKANTKPTKLVLERRSRGANFKKSVNRTNLEKNIFYIERHRLFTLIRVRLKKK
jgi:hypothetical protein